MESGEDIYTARSYQPREEMDEGRYAPEWGDAQGRADRPTRDKKFIFLPAADLRMKLFPPLRYVVPNFIVEGCTLLAGRPKLGKSWLVLDMALAVADNRYTLNEQCPEGDVLYLALEDNLRRLKGRINKVLGPLADQWPARLHLATESPRSNEGGIEAIRDWAQSVENPRLVIVDVLAMFKPVRGDRETLYEADYGAIKGLQQLALDLGIAIVVVHHTRKGAGDVDPFEKVSGTLGLSGAADTTIILDRDQNGFTLYGRGRDIPEFEHAVSYDRETCRFSVLGKAEEVRRTDERGSILSALFEATEPMNPRDLSIASGMPRNNVDQLLFKMAKHGEVMKSGRGFYVHPDRRDLIASTTPSPRKTDKKVRKGSATEGTEEAKIPADLIVALEPIRTADKEEAPSVSDIPGDREPDHGAAAAPDVRLSIPATDFLKWLRSRAEQPVNAAIIGSHAPRHTRTKDVLPIVISELEKADLIRGETRTAKGKKASRFIHLTATDA